MRIATDIGGTFTDLVHLDEDTGEIGLAKASTTPPFFERGVLDALAGAGMHQAEDVSSFIHGTTVVINTVTERTGAKTASIATRGFRDVLDITRSNRPGLYDLRYRKPQGFVPRHLCFEATERLSHRGVELVPLSEDDVLRAIELMRDEGVEAVAVCFLHAYVNPEHEIECGKILARGFPEVSVTLSHEVTREWREYERTSTAVLNAYVRPRTRSYLDALECGVDQLGIRDGLYVMHSGGGMMSFGQARATPINLLESGPVAGVVGAVAIGALTGHEDIIAFDVGGTTAKTSLVEAGEMKVTTEYRIDRTPFSPGYPVKIPVVDIVEIGAGGGSIAWLDATGVLNVGPRSAGAVPGPACYPDGGDKPTVTDANLIAGRINPSFFLGGRIAVSVARARNAMASVASPLGLDIDTTAMGVIKLADAKMVNAIRLVSVRRGHDPRDFALVAFGGGGSLHAAAMAMELQIGTVIVPPAPGHFSAWGMLMTDLQLNVVQTRVLRSDEIDASVLSETWEALEAEATERLEGEGRVDARAMRAVRAADMRYKGQEHTVTVPVSGARLDDAGVVELIDRFHELHQQRYTFRLDAAVELVTFRVTVVGTTAKPSLPSIATGTGDPDSAVVERRVVDFGDWGRHETPIYRRERLLAGDAFSGPAIVDEPAANTVVFPGQRVNVDDWGCVVIRTEAA